MGKSKIQWTDETWNPVVGCTKVSQGCKFCYAERLYPRVYPGHAFTTVRLMPERLEQPLGWRKPRMVFVNSMSDLFHENIPASFIVQCFEVMGAAPQHTYQILTKRTERIYPVLFGEEGGFYLGGGDFYPHILLGVSVEDQVTADDRIPKLLTSGWVGKKFVSYEPALGPVDFKNFIPTRCCSGVDCGCMGKPIMEPPYLDWIIAGGESGPKARPSHPDWFRAVRNQCQAAGVPFFFKQWGEWVPNDQDSDYLTGKGTVRASLAGDGNAGVSGLWRKAGKKAAGRLLDGREWNEFPKH